MKNFVKVTKARKIEKEQLLQGENSTRNCHCAKSEDSLCGVNKCEKV